MDGTDPASSLPRYKALAMMSPPRYDPSQGSAAGTSLMPALAPASTATGERSISTTPRTSGESQAIGGGSTLTDEWLNRTNQSSVSTVGGWNGDLYDPPGVNITLGMHNTSIKGGFHHVAGIRMTRFDTGAQAQTFAWLDSTGAALTGTAMDGTSASTMIVPYDTLSASNDLAANPAGLAGAAVTNYQNNPNNDVLIYAEGNVRVHGIVSPNEGTAASPTTLFPGTSPLSRTGRRTLTATCSKATRIPPSRFWPMTMSASTRPSSWPGRAPATMPTICRPAMRRLGKQHQFLPL